MNAQKLAKKLQKIAIKDKDAIAYLIMIADEKETSSKLNFRTTDLGKVLGFVSLLATVNKTLWEIMKERGLLGKVDK